MKYFLGSEGHRRPIDKITHLNIPQSLNGKIWFPSWRDCLDILVCKLELSLHLSSIYTINGIWYPFYNFYIWMFKKEKKISCVPLLILYPRFPPHSVYIYWARHPVPWGYYSAYTVHPSLVVITFLLSSLPHSFISLKALTSLPGLPLFSLGASEFYTTNVWMSDTVLGWESPKGKIQSLSSNSL